MLKKLVYVFLLVSLTACSGISSATPVQEATALPPTVTPEPLPSPTPFIQVFPVHNTELQLFSAHIQVIRVSDDDGQNIANITVDEIIQQVNRANEIFATASIRFLFDPQKDVDFVQSTVIANMLAKDDLRWREEMDLADEVAAKYPDKLVVFVRHKPVDESAGRGNFFWWDYNFGILPIIGEDVCGSGDDTRLAHEIGHYLGLGNTYSEVFSDIESAEEAYNRSGYNLSAFDGDTFKDTPPDLAIAGAEYQCGVQEALAISNTSIPISRGNLMSNYYPRSLLSPEQIARARYMLAKRYSNGMVMPSNRGLKQGFELENATILEHRWSSSSVMDMTPYSARNWSAGKQLHVVSGYGSGLMIEFSVAQDGVYLMKLYATHSPDYGVLEVEVDDILVNDYVDLYAPFTYASGPIGLGPYYLTKGTHQMLFKVTKKNDLSSGYNFGLDAITVELQKQ